MVNYNLQIQKLLLQFEKAEKTVDRINLLKEAIKIADASNDLDWGIELRDDLMYEEKGTCSTRESLPAFVWLLNTIGANPDLFDEKEYLNHYRWMVAALQRNLSVSREEIESAQDDYKVRLIRSGYSIYPYYNQLMVGAIMRGDREKAVEFQELRDKEVLESDRACIDCINGIDAELALLSGDFDKAIFYGEKVFSKNDTCYYEPLSVTCSLLLHLTLAKDERASKYYQQSIDEYSKVDSESFQILNVSAMILYASLYDKDEAWELFTKVATWNIDADDYYSFFFSISLLPLFKEKVTRTLNLNSILPYFDEKGIYDTADLYSYFDGESKRLADAFDNRDKTKYYSSLYEKVGEL